MNRRFLLPAVTLAVALILAACGSTEKTAPAPQGQASTTAAASAPEALSGEDFLTKAPSLSGKTVTLRRCSLLTTPGSDGTLPCRVLDNTSAEITGFNGLPVDIFVKEADLSPEARAVVAGCSGMCTVEISGKLDRATDGTGYLSMSAVTLKAVS